MISIYVLLIDCNIRKKLSREEDLSEAKEAEEMAKKLGIKQVIIVYIISER